jgi:hypothetical protein
MEGIIALQNVGQQGAMGHAAEGDQLWPGSPIARLFDPPEMEVDVNISEADHAVLSHLGKATVHLDAFPSVVLSAHFDSASPVATSNVGVPVKNFAGRFVIDQADPPFCTGVLRRWFPTLTPIAQRVTHQCAWVRCSKRYQSAVLFGPSSIIRDWF